MIYEHWYKRANKVFTLGNIRFYECPLTYITAETWEIIRILYLVEKTNLPYYPGSWSEQPAWYFQASRVFEEEQNRKVKKAKAELEAKTSNAKGKK